MASILDLHKNYFLLDFYFYLLRNNVFFIVLHINRLDEVVKIDYLHVNSLKKNIIVRLNQNLFAIS